MLHDKAAYLMAALRRLTAHIQHGIFTGATYEEVTVAHENLYGDHHRERSVPHSDEEKDPVR
jgi:hypothetical protein